MTDTKKISEKRKYKRFKGKEGASAVLYKRDNIIGMIIDISRGGLAFRYMDEAKETRGTSQLGLFFTGEEFYLQIVQINTIYDVEEAHKVSFSNLRMRRCGVKFGKLTDYEAFLLKHFIGNYALGEA